MRRPGIPETPMLVASPFSVACSRPSGRDAVSSCEARTDDRVVIGLPDPPSSRCARRGQLQLKSGGGYVDISRTAPGGRVVMRVRRKFIVSRYEPGHLARRAADGKDDAPERGVVLHRHRRAPRRSLEPGGHMGPGPAARHGEASHCHRIAGAVTSRESSSGARRAGKCGVRGSALEGDPAGQNSGPGAYCPSGDRDSDPSHSSPAAALGRARHGPPDPSVGGGLTRVLARAAVHQRPPFLTMT